MTSSKSIYVYIGASLLVLSLLGAFIFAYLRTKELEEMVIASPTTRYICSDSRSFTASFGNEELQVTLDDGRELNLSQTRTALGMRYESDQALFIGKGSDATLEINGEAPYEDCVVNASEQDPVEGVSEFTDAGGVFTFTYPSTFSVSSGETGYTQGWMQNATTLGLVLAQVNVPRTFMPNTTFSEATLTIGTSADPVALEECHAVPEGGAVEGAETTVNGITYTRFKYSDAGAGNVYETTSYRLLRNDQCYAIEYTIHSTNIANYPEDSGVTEFDRTRVTAALESIVRSVVWHAGK